MVALRNIVNRLDKQSTVHFSLTQCVRYTDTYSHSLNIFLAFDQVEPNFGPDSRTANDKDTESLQREYHHKDIVLINSHTIEYVCVCEQSTRVWLLLFI